MNDLDRSGEVGQEDEARLQRRDEQGLAPVVVTRDLGAELTDPTAQLGRGEVDLADAAGVVYEASSSRYRCARRSTSRL